MLQGYHYSYWSPQLQLHAPQMVLPSEPLLELGDLEGTGGCLAGDAPCLTGFSTEEEAAAAVTGWPRSPDPRWRPRLPRSPPIDNRKTSVKTGSVEVTTWYTSKRWSELTQQTMQQKLSHLSPISGELLQG